jgi:hypothetical protein
VQHINKHQHVRMCKTVCSNTHTHTHTHTHAHTQRNANAHVPTRTHHLFVYHEMTRHYQKIGIHAVSIREYPPACMHTAL